MNTFPLAIRAPSQLNFWDEKSSKAVLVADTASGYPVLNKLFTFDPRTFSFEMLNVPDADKIVLVTFYEDNKDVPFYWTNDQDGVQYEVIFVNEPRCKTDGRKDFWKIALNLRQSAP